MFWVSKYWGLPVDVLNKIDIFLHNFLIPYATIACYVLLHCTFKRKMAASKMLSSESHIQQAPKETQSNRVQRQFVKINCVLIAILVICSQPSAILWLIREFWLSAEETVQLSIVHLFIDNILYLKFMFDPFVYAWRLPKYREALWVIFPAL